MCVCVCVQMLSTGTRLNNRCGVHTRFHTSFHQVLEALIGGMRIEEEANDRDVDSRVNCTRALGAACQTLLGAEGQSDVAAVVGPSEAVQVLHRQVWSVESSVVVKVRGALYWCEVLPPDEAFVAGLFLSPPPSDAPRPSPPSCCPPGPCLLPPSCYPLSTLLLPPSLPARSSLPCTRPSRTTPLTTGAMSGHGSGMQPWRCWCRRCSCRHSCCTVKGRWGQILAGQKPTRTSSEVSGRRGGIGECVHGRACMGEVKGGGGA